MILRPDFVMHCKSCSVNTTVTPYYTVVCGSKHAQVMGNRIFSFCHYKVMPFQPVSLQVTDVNVFLRKNNNRFSIMCKNAKVSKRQAWKFSVPETVCVCLSVCVCVCGGGGNNALLVLPVCTKTCI